MDRKRFADVNRFAAVDTRFLLALHTGDEDCQGVVDWLMGNNIFINITSCVIQELVDMTINASTDEAKSAAKAVLECIPTWGFLASEPLSPLNNGIAYIVAQKLLDSGVIHTDLLNDCLAVVEAAFEECAMFVTTRQPLVDASYDHLRLALIENHIPDLFITTPSEIMSFVQSKSPPAEEEASPVI